MIETLFRVSCDNPKCKTQQEFSGNIKLQTILKAGWSRIRSAEEEGKWTFLCPKCTIDRKVIRKMLIADLVKLMKAMINFLNTGKDTAK